MKFITFILFNYNTITNFILIIYDLSNLDHVLAVVLQARVSGWNRTHDPHANSLVHFKFNFIFFSLVDLLKLHENSFKKKKKKRF